MEQGRDGVESVAQMCNFISEFYCVQRGGGGRERVRENKNLEVNDDAFSGIRTGDLCITDPALDPALDHQDMCWKKNFGKYLKNRQFALIHIYPRSNRWI